MESFNIINTLANKNPGSEKVLIYIGNRATIDIDRCVAGKKPSEKSPANTLRCHFNPRLQDRVAGDDIAGVRIKSSDILGVGKRTDKLLYRTRWQSRICIHRNHKTNVGQRRTVTFVQ